MEWEDSLNALVSDDTSDGESFVYSAAFSGYYGSGEDLDTDFVAFLYAASYVDGVAYFKMRYALL